MIKFLHLVRNEWKKEFAKKTLWWMLISLILFAILVSAISAGSFSEAWYTLEFHEMCEEEIAWFESLLADTDPANDAELDNYRINIEAYRMMLDAEMDWNDWRYELDLAWTAAEAKYDGNTAVYDTLVAIIRSNDPNQYYQWKKAEYLVRYADDPELQMIYTDAMDACMQQGILPIARTDWRYERILTSTDSRVRILTQERLRDSGGAWSEQALEAAKNALAIAQYQLEHDIPINPADSFTVLSESFSLTTSTSDVKSGGHYWRTMVSTVSLLSLISVFVIVLAGSSVVSEFSSGTIRYLLISPVKRWKILMAKYTTCLTIGLLMATMLWLVTMVTALVTHASEAFLPAIFAQNGEIRFGSPYLLLLKEYLLAMVQTVVMATMALSISTLTKHSSVAIGITIFVNLIGTSIVTALQLLGFDWARYLLFANLDFAAIVNGTSVFAHHSICSAIVIVGLHMVVFLWTAWDAFTKREI